eukprot:GHVT01073792.1.p1 GENE.GHVT01073792.1~~GHVT01073792.1.p1  ORF type:complete len:241 (-),score=81.84 GHVT01073792.1:159-881(-)
MERPTADAAPPPLTLAAAEAAAASIRKFAGLAPAAESLKRLPERPAPNSLEETHPDNSKDSKDSKDSSSSSSASSSSGSGTAVAYRVPPSTARGLSDALLSLASRRGQQFPLQEISSLIPWTQAEIVSATIQLENSTATLKEEERLMDLETASLNFSSDDLGDSGWASLSTASLSNLLQFCRNVAAIADEWQRELGPQQPRANKLEPNYAAKPSGRWPRPHMPNTYKQHKEPETRSLHLQ